ncbi:MAG TPA: CopD family protein [Rubrivivax sp.]|nr:CopD family protein [Rubrivivax sp.]
MASHTLRTLHVLAVVLWVGGMAFAHFFLRPALGVLEPAQRLRLMHDVLRRFLNAALVAVLLILASGTAMIGIAARAIAAAPAGFVMPPDWTAMTVVGLVMAVVFGHVRFVLLRRMGLAVQASQWPAAGAAMASIRRWVALNLALGTGLSALVLAW